MPPIVRIRASGPDRGFTLIELIVVMAIIAIGSFALRPGIVAMLNSARERAAVRQLVSLFTAARAEAVMQGKLIRVVYEDSSGSFHAEIQLHPEINRAEFQSVTLLGKRGFCLPEQLLLQRLEIAGAEASEGVADLYFYPDGRTDGAQLLLVNTRGAETTITVASTTGRVHIDV